MGNISLFRPVRLAYKAKLRSLGRSSILAKTLRFQWNSGVGTFDLPMFCRPGRKRR